MAVVNVPLNVLLRDLVDEETLAALPKELRVSGIALHSYDVQQGSAFFAIPGNHYKGWDFIDEAIARGAVVIVQDVTAPKQSLSVPVVVVAELAAKLSLIAQRFYTAPDRDLYMIGVTGTNGKTTCTQQIAGILTQLHKPCAVIGTLGYGVFPTMTAGYNTTPNGFVLHRLLDEFRLKNVKHVAMEVSSHALAEARVRGISFKIAVFTNLTRDHLDYHGGMQAYGAAKRRLFEQNDLQAMVINADDAFGSELLEDTGLSAPKYGYSLQAPNTSKYPCVWVDAIKQDFSGIQARLHTPWGDAHLRAPMLGLFNLSNLLAVITVFGVMGYSLDELLPVLDKGIAIKGRMERFGGDKRPLVIVDYAHTPDALEKTLVALKEHSHGKLFCVFGCGGDRDHGKRPIMGSVAERFADRVILTDDNPRTEDPKAIIAEITQGMQHPQSVEIVHDRKHAIHHALDTANSGDIVLIAGKGHETYQSIGEHQIPYSDQEVVENYWVSK